MKVEEALDHTVIRCQETHGLGYYLCVCKSAGLGGLGVASVGQVEPRQVWHETCLGLFPFC